MATDLKTLTDRLAASSGSARLTLLVELAEALRESDGLAGLTLVREAIAAADAAGAPTIKGQLMGTHALLLERTGEYEQALTVLDDLQDLAAQLGSSDLLTRAWNARGILLSNLGHLDEALRYLLMGAEICEEAAQFWQLSSMLNNIGVIYGRLGLTDRADQYYQQSLRMSGSVGRQDTRLHAISNLGFNSIQAGRHREALSFQTEALVLARQSGARYTETLCLGNIAECHAALGDTEHAHRTFQEATALARTLRASSYLADILYEHARVYLRDGDHVRAAHLLREALTEVDHMGGFHHELPYRLLYAQSLLAAQQPEEARTELMRAVATPDHAGTRRDRLTAYGLLRELHWKAGQPDLAQETERQHRALQQTLDLSTPDWHVLTPAVEAFIAQWKADAATAGRPLYQSVPPASADLRAALSPEQWHGQRQRILDQLAPHVEAAQQHLQHLALMVIDLSPISPTSEWSPVPDPGYLHSLIGTWCPALTVLGTLHPWTAVAVLPNTAPQPTVTVATHLIRDLVHAVDPPITVSVGCCTTTAWAHVEDMLQAAERLQRQAQGLGGNRVCASGQHIGPAVRVG